MGCGIYWQQVKQIEGALETMTRFGLSTDSAEYQKLAQARAGLLSRSGPKLPRETTWLGIYPGMSPGEVKVWFDLESGWFTEYRAYTGALPRYKSISGPEAVLLIKREASPDLVGKVETADAYIGE